MLEVDAEVDRRDFTVRASFRVAPGERLALFGPSGAGKTTLLETIAGLVGARRARITLAGRLLTSTDPPVTRIPPWQRRVGLLRQDPGLFPHLSVRDNLRYAPSAHSADGAAGVAALAGTLGIGTLLEVMPAALSGGQAHRVALGRLLLARCDALLLDEPYSGLDMSLRRQLTDLVTGLVGERAIPAILVAHDLADAQAFASRLAVLDQGEILQEGGPDEVVVRPGTRRVAELVGYCGFIPVRPAGAVTQDALHRGSSETALVAGIHPDHVLAGSHPEQGLVVSGAIRAARPSGAGWEATVAAGQATVIVRLPDRPAAPGGQLTVTAVSPPYFGPDGAAADLGEQALEQVTP